MPIITYQQRFIIGDSRVTSEGGFCKRYRNNTGGPSKKGTIVCACGTMDNAVELVGANDDDPMGVIYDDGVPDGDWVWVVRSGTAQVLLKDTVAADRGDWVKVSATVAGRAEVASTPPGSDPSHWKEVGHCEESRSAGTDVLVFCAIHFN